MGVILANTRRAQHIHVPIADLPSVARAQV